MPRIVLGNCGSALALAQARLVLSELSGEWPDVHIMQKTIQNSARENANNSAETLELLKALQEEKINIAVQALETLPLDLPEGLVLAAVSKRLEPRSALVAKGQKSLKDLPPAALVGVANARDAAFLKASRKDLVTTYLSGNIDTDLGQLASGDLAALIVSSACLIQLDRRQRIDALLDTETFTPAVGQGSLGLVVREDDDLANDVAYSLQHRPSFDRAMAERSFARTFQAASQWAVGALASVSSDGELSLLGTVADTQGEVVIQAEISGEAAEAAELGRELARDVLEQLKNH